MHSGARTIGVEEKRKALEQVLASRTFVHCDQLKRFLTYVCELEFVGREGEIHEYLTGTEALGRRKDFSPQDDSTVRSRAYSLRQKLQEYYERETPAALIRIDLPRGSYVPLFVEVGGSVPTGDAPVEAPLSLPEPHGKLNWTLAASFAAGATLVALIWIATAWFVRPSSPKPNVDPIVAQAWGPLVRPNANVAVCVSTPPHLHLQSYPDGLVDLPYHNPPLLRASPEITAFYETFRLSKPGTPVYMWRSRNSTLLGVTLGVSQAVSTLATFGASFEVIPEKAVGHMALQGRNIMRFGSPLDSEEIAFDLSHVPFSIRFDSSIGDDVISGSPPGKPARVFIPKRLIGMTYGLLTVMPTDGSNNLHRTVIASGISSAGTQAAIEFFRLPQHLRELKARLNAEGYQSFPLAYQVIVQCVTIDALEAGLPTLAGLAVIK